MIRKSWLILVLLAVSLSACNSQTVTEKTSVFQVTSDGVKTVEISSEKSPGPEQQLEVKNKLTEMVNGGNHNVVSITTKYVGGHLLEARVTYLPDQGEGNKVRVSLYTSDNFYLVEMERDIATQTADLSKEDYFLINEIQDRVGGEDIVVAAEYFWIEK